MLKQQIDKLKKVKNMKTAMVIGATGLVGGKLIERLVNEGGFEKTKALYPNVFEKSLNTNKIRSANKKPSKVTFRTAQYSEVKKLWEKINQKVVLEYKINGETEFQQLLKSYFL